MSWCERTDLSLSPEETRLLTEEEVKRLREHVLAEARKRLGLSLSKDERPGGAETEEVTWKP